MDLNDKFNQMTTRIVAEAGGRTSEGTGFFYTSLEQSRGEGPRWRRVEEMWIATNRHVLLPKICGAETIPDRVTVYLRRMNERGMMEWVDVVLEGWS